MARALKRTRPSSVDERPEATSFVRSRGQPVIAINADREIGSNIMEVMEALQAGARDFVVKPLRRDCLLPALARISRQG